MQVRFWPEKVRMLVSWCGHADCLGAVQIPIVSQGDNQNVLLYKHYERRSANYQGNNILTTKEVMVKKYVLLKVSCAALILELSLQCDEVLVEK